MANTDDFRSAVLRLAWAFRSALEAATTQDPKGAIGGEEAVKIQQAYSLISPFALNESAEFANSTHATIDEIVRRRKTSGRDLGVNLQDLQDMADHLYRQATSLSREEFHTATERIKRLGAIAGAYHALHLSAYYAGKGQNPDVAEKERQNGMQALEELGIGIPALVGTEAGGGIKSVMDSLLPMIKSHQTELSKLFKGLPPDTRPGRPPEPYPTGPTPKGADTRGGAHPQLRA